ncbi:MAG: nitroreductase family protein [Thermomicrobiales bacterium]
MTRTSGSVADTVFDVIKSRRVTRSFTGEPVADDLLARMVAAARWASSAGNRHVHKFFITRDPAKIDLIRSFSPGMLTSPPAVILILTDRDVAARERLQDGDDANQVDVGTAAQNMMTMAHALGLGSCPVTSFSKSGVAGVLGLPASLTPELMLIVGHPQPVSRAMPTNAPKPVRARDLTYWEEVGRHGPN